MEINSDFKLYLFLDKYPYQYLTNPYYDDQEISDYISNPEDIEKDYMLQIKNGAIDKQDSLGNPVDVCMVFLMLASDR